jgi:hypothetical protein
MTSLDMSKNRLLTKEGGEILGKMLKTNSVLKDLNVSQSGWGLFSSEADGPGFAQKLAVGIKDNGALKSLNISNINTGELVLQEMDKSLCLKGCAYGFHKKGCPNEGTERKSIPEGAIALADAIKTNGALTSLNMSKNRNTGAEAGKAIGDALAGNTVLKELDLSGEQFYPNMDIGFVRAFAPGLSDNGALPALNLADNNLGKMVPPEGWSYGYHGDYSGNKFYKHTDGREMKSGTPEGMTSGAIVIADAMPDMGALTSLNLANNGLGNIVLPEGWTRTTKTGVDRSISSVFKHDDGREQKENPGSKPEGIIAIANAIPDMRALLQLDMSDNLLSTENERAIAKLCDSKGIMVTFEYPMNSPFGGGSDY